MNLKIVPTFTATIYIGLKHHYSGDEMQIQIVEDFIQNWVNKIGMCVSVTKTHFLYSNGNEYGLIIGFINYPRFPSDEQTIREKVIDA